MRSLVLMGSIFLTIPMGSAGGLSAHPGGLNAQGCHNNRKTGEYHCHNTSVSPTPRTRNERDSGGEYFQNCDAARAAGKAPIYRGQPGYRPGLDRDNDGVACEPYRGKR